MEINGISLSEYLLFHLKRTGAAKTRLSQDDAWAGRVQKIHLSVQGGVPKEADSGFEGHLLQGTRIILNTHPVKWLVSSIEGHVVSHQGQVAWVHHDTVGLEHVHDFSHDGAICCLYPVIPVYHFQISDIIWSTKQVLRI